MTADTLTAILANISSGPNYVPPFSTYTLGRKAHRAGLPYSICVCDEMRSGWLASEGDAGWLQRSERVVSSRNLGSEFPVRRARLGGVPGGSEQ